MSEQPDDLTHYMEACSRLTAQLAAEREAHRNHRVVRKGNEEPVCETCENTVAYLRSGQRQAEAAREAAERVTLNVWQYVEQELGPEKAAQVSDLFSQTSPDQWFLAFLRVEAAERKRDEYKRLWAREEARWNEAFPNTAKLQHDLQQAERRLEAVREAVEGVDALFKSEFEEGVPAVVEDAWLQLRRAVLSGELSTKQEKGAT